MPDRVDTSQYPAASDWREVKAPDFPDGVTDEYPHYSPEYATAKELTGYAHPADLPHDAIQRPPLTVTDAPLTHEIRYRTLNGSGAIATGRTRFAGLALRETAGAPAVVRIRDGVDTQGGIVWPVSLAAGESIRDYLPVDSAIKLNNGLYVEIVSGTVEGTVLVVADFRE